MRCLCIEDASPRICIARIIRLVFTGQILWRASPAVVLVIITVLYSASRLQVLETTSEKDRTQQQLEEQAQQAAADEAEASSQRRALEAKLADSTAELQAAQHTLATVRDEASQVREALQQSQERTQALSAELTTAQKEVMSKAEVLP